MALTHFPKHCMALAGFILLSFAAEARAEDIRWRTDFATARAEAVRRNQPMILVVESASCGWCRKLEQTTFRDGRVVRELNETAVPFRLNADDPANSELIESLRVEGLPTIAGIAPDGRAVATQSGYLEAPQFLKLMESMRDKIERSKKRRGERPR